MLMQDAYSRLKFVLTARHMTTADLVRRVQEQGDRVNPKSIYRLADPEEVLEKVDMRVVGAVCQALQISLGDLLTFEEPIVMDEFSADRQARMNVLMARHHARSDGPLAPKELAELEGLVEEAEAVARGNARRLAARRRRLLREAGRLPSPDPEKVSSDSG